MPIPLGIMRYIRDSRGRPYETIYVSFLFDERIANVLHREGVRTAADLLTKRPTLLATKVKGLGRRSVEEIDEVITELKRGR